MNLRERAIRGSNNTMGRMNVSSIPESSGSGNGDNILMDIQATTSIPLYEHLLDRDRNSNHVTSAAPENHISNQSLPAAPGDHRNTVALNLGEGVSSVSMVTEQAVNQSGLVAGGSGPASNSHPCVVCERSFSTKSGLGVHIRRAHPDVSDQMNVRSDKKARWNDEEISLLACTEAELTSSGGVRFMNHALHERFAHRTVEAIKKMRQRSEYKVKVQTYLTRLVDPNRGPTNIATAWVQSQQTTMEASEIVAETDPIVDSPVSGDAPTVDDPIKSFLLSLGDLDIDSYSAPYLNSIVRSVNDDDKDHVLLRLSGYLDEIFPPNLESRQRVRPRQPPTFTNRRKRRRHEYAKVQRDWRKHNGRCIKAILDDTESCSQPARDVMETYWREVIEREEHSAPLREDLARYSRGSIWYPISRSDLKASMPVHTTSPGIDGITSRQFRALPIEILERVFNLFMWCGKVPRRFREAKTIFLPKKQKPSLPEDYRPITLTSILLRWFHSILAKRISRCIKFERSQKGFMPTDGCADNTTLIDHLLREHHQNYASCHIAVLDVSKAFDSVSHNTIYGTLESYGQPQELVDYIRHIYSTSRIRFSGDSWVSDQLVLPGRGVKQGDPLSPVLFNLVMDRLIRKLPPELGCKIGNFMTNIAAFADDLVIWASTPLGLQKLLDIASEFLGSCGLKLNSAKCLSVSIKGQPKQKRSVVVQKEFYVEGRAIRALKRTEEWKYLGVTFTAEGRTKVDLKAPLREKLDRLTRAPLKPQQRLFALRSVLIPQLYHVLTLGNVMIGCLRGIDRTIRAYLRKWLSLPDDVPIAYFHASVEDGGLGIVSLRWQAPLLRLKRLQELQLPLPSGIVSVDTFVASEVAKVERRLDTGDVRILSKGDLKAFWADRLYKSFDGRGLLHSSDHKQAQRWIREPTRLLSGRDFINCIKLRINALPTRSRCTRGRTSDRKCRAGCDAQETLNHIVQGCFRTKRDRTNRHDSVVKFMGRSLRAKGLQVVVEDQLQTTSGIRKPDIVVLKGEKIYVLDAQVVTDGRDLSNMHKEKTDKYNTQGVIRALTEKYGRNQVQFCAITLNWRGVWSRDSVNRLVEWGLLGKRETALISTRVMIGGIISHRRFMGSRSNRSGIG